jgi:hypothetical protein
MMATESTLEENDNTPEKEWFPVGYEINEKN